ncbi:uncharacterized protein LOC117585297 [Drosophila guanche]|uniref:Uncharacterized protein n=1 Tax=Drosophila guanche TaxID=7266 RepID=A0A3B0J185_DROGU|nr:uncharacterized protein LOC117585297 [Drosophila guanche]SPP74605.1 Hypothetical predicted protein [Drosophila guanche]
MEKPTASERKLPKKNELTKKRTKRSHKKESLSVEKLEMEEDASENQSDVETEDDVDTDEGESGQQEAAVGVSSMFAEMKEKDEKEDNAKVKFTAEDLKSMEELSRMPLAAMVAHIQALDTELYELSQRETRELSRSKHLRIFSNYRRRSK